MAKTMYIDSIEPNQSGRGEVFTIKEIQKHKTKAGDPYYNITFVDKTGSVKGKVWKNDFSSCNVETLKGGDIVEIDFESSTFNGSLQFTVKKMDLTEDYNLYDLIKMTDKDLDKMYARLLEYLESMKDSDLRDIVLKLAKDDNFAEELKHAIAAEKVHHDFVGGLLEHMLEMYAMAETLVKIYPRANRSIVFAGIFFHDIGKIEELAMENAAFIRTKAGYLVGHMTLGMSMFEKALPEDFPEEKKLAVQHIILSHHGKKEYGSPIQPATLEAIIVHAVDYSSSNIRQFQKEFDERTPDEMGFGQYHPFQKNKIYHTKIEEEE